jgi:DNA-binding NtrC family response regulator
MSQLAAYDWAGKVRELQNAVERAVILAQGGPLRFDLGLLHGSIASVEGTTNQSLTWAP